MKLLRDIAARNTEVANSRSTPSGDCRNAESLCECCSPLKWWHCGDDSTARGDSSDAAALAPRFDVVDEGRMIAAAQKQMMLAMADVR